MPKRDLKLYVRSLLSALLLCAILSAVCVAAAFALMKTADNSAETAKVALADNDNSLMGRVLINTIEEAYLSSLLDVTRTDELSALEGVKNGEYVAAIVLPVGFIDNVSFGSGCEGMIYLSNKARSEAHTIASIVEFGERLMVAGQCGVFAGERLIKEDGLTADVHAQFLDGANADLLNEALGFNSKYFAFETVDYHGTGMPTKSYYALCWLLLFLFLISLFFIPLFVTDCNRGMLIRLFSHGIGPVRFMSTKLVLMVATRGLLLGAACMVFRKLGIVFPDVMSVVFAIVGILCITLVGTALTMCLGDGITGNVVSVVIGMFLCGGIVPLPMIPEAVATIGKFTPYGTAKAFLEPLFGAAADPEAMTVGIIYAAVSVVLVKNKLERVIAGRC